METGSQQKKRQRKFNPPLKVPTGDISQSSYYSSWSSSLTQTHTVLSYCEQDLEDQVAAAAAQNAIERKGGAQTARNFTLQRSQRRYNYGVCVMKESKKPTKHPTKTSAGTGTNVYDYCLTPQDQVEQRRHKTRSKEQVRNVDFLVRSIFFFF